MIVFVLFNICSINLFHEWNPLLKNLFHIFLEHIKTDLIFSVIENHFFLFLKTDPIFHKPKPFFSKFLKTDLILFFLFKKNQKTLFYLINIDLNFPSKNHFFLHNKSRFDFFYELKSNYFTHNNSSDFFFKQRRGCIHK